MRVVGKELHIVTSLRMTVVRNRGTRSVSGTIRVRFSQGQTHDPGVPGG
jgi:hypothetical protein